MKSLNQYQSVMQTICDIVKAHGGELKMETKEVKGVSLLLSYPLSEPQIRWIALINMNEL